MICKNVIDKISNLIQREINTADRIMIIEHLKKCDSCRGEYLNQLKMFYLLDKELVKETKSLDQSKFFTDLESRISTSDSVNKYRSFIWYGYAAAAILFILIISFILFERSDWWASCTPSTSSL